MAPMKKLIETVLPGRPVRIRPRGIMPPGIPKEKHVEGIVLKAITMPDGSLRVYVETDRSCATPPQLYGLAHVDLLEVNEEVLRKNLRGRRVHFPDRPGIGIDFPDGASEYGNILAVNYIEECLTISVGIEVSGLKSLWVAVADFTQCDLVPCSGADNE